ncbi:MAG: TetR/AcrR family transcriptional regulator [Gilvibacter sp.]
MLTKAEKTKKHIIQTVAPLFNQKGYAATSMRDITLATGLTKGAIYGNFENKEALAAAAFKANINKLLQRVATHQLGTSSPLGKLFLITDFYRHYYENSKPLGGCPILNIGVDAKHQDSPLLDMVCKVIKKTQLHIENLVLQAQETNELSTSLSAQSFAKTMYGSIQGAIFMMQTLDDPSYLTEAANSLESALNQHKI